MEGPLKKSKPASVPGLLLVKDFVTPQEEETLLAHVNNSPWNTALKRRTQHYGYIYDYTSREAAQKTDPIPEWATFLTERLKEQKHASLLFDQMIVNEYKQWQGISPHIDHIKFFDREIVSVSLGEEMVMSFSRDGEETIHMPLPRRSALILTGEARYKWRHSIDGKQKHNGTRVSLTFRKMKNVAL